ncbi:MAG: hypothetical protein KGD67_03495 [Candidatus Lokiarchaeota archaeon]|nr:hypothetical protein [Candidatus Lokiarchaeota archaeon]
MLKTYIFDEANKKWIEEPSSLLYHDLCALLDEDRNIIYVWNGPKSSQERLKVGCELLKKMVSNYPNNKFQISVLNKKVPDYVQFRLTKMLSKIKHDNRNEFEKFSKFITLRLYFVFSLSALIFPLFSLLKLSTSLAWRKTGYNYEVSSGLYNDWLLISLFFIILTILSFAFILTIGIIEIEYKIITYSIIGLVISSGIAIYLQQGIFLFLFQDGSTTSIFYIKQTDIHLFLFIIVIGIVIYELPNLVEFINFIKIYRKFIL